MTKGMVKITNVLLHCILKYAVLCATENSVGLGTRPDLTYLANTIFWDKYIPGCQIPMYKWFTSKVAHASCYLSGEAQEHSWHFRRKIANRPAGTDVIRQEKLLSCYRKDFLIGCLPHVTSMKSTIKSIAICSISCSRSNITIFMESVLLFPISTYRQKHRSYIDWPLYIGIENQQLEHCV